MSPVIFMPHPETRACQVHPDVLETPERPCMFCWMADALRAALAVVDAPEPEGDEHEMVDGPLGHPESDS